jgi:ubiquinone biosynthesis protein
MFKRVFSLFKIAKKLSNSGAIDTINQIHSLPLPIILFFNIFSIGSPSKSMGEKKTPGEKLCIALQAMGTTFIKLGQFLATRPDIIGEEIANDLEKLQDKVPAFDIYEAKKIIKNEIGEDQFKNIIEISEPIAAASIAQVHIAKIKNENENKEVAIKILRPDIERLFNEELDALMLFAYIVENTFTKAKRLKLVEVVYLLREITNVEMDLRFEAAAANELYENTKNDKGFDVPKIYWNYTTKKILTLDKVDGISIREHEKLGEQGINLRNLAENFNSTFFKTSCTRWFFSR